MYRRGFITGLGATALGVLGGTALSVADTSAVKDRFVIDTSDAPSGWREGIEVIHELPPINAAVVRGTESAVNNLRATRDIQIEVDPPATVGETVAPDEFPESNSGGAQPPGYYIWQWDKYDQNLDKVHQEKEVTGEEARIGIIDTGTALYHPEFRNNGDPEASRNFTGDGGDYNPVGSDHGTHVGGIAAAGGALVTGTAPDATVVSLRVFSGPFARTGDILAAIVYSAIPKGADIELEIGGNRITGGAGCDVSNLSLSAYPVPQGVESKIFRDLYERASAFTNELGTVLVAAAGNDSTNLDADGDVLGFPIEADGYVTVSATGPIGFQWDEPEVSYEDGFFGQFPVGMETALQRLQEPTTSPAFYTNYGAEAVDLSAAGGDADLDVLTQGAGQVPWYLDLVFNAALNNGEPEYGWKAGTSMAAPQVTGAVALIKSVYPDASPQQVLDHLQETADVIDVNDIDGTSELYRGANGGHLDVPAAVSTPLGETSNTGPTFSEPIQVGDEEIGPPRDLDGDGLHEDVNGDGTFDEDDARALLRLATFPAEIETELNSDQLAALDVDEDGRITDNDAQQLLRMARNQGGNNT